MLEIVNRRENGCELRSRQRWRLRNHREWVRISIGCRNRRENGCEFRSQQQWQLRNRANRFISASVVETVTNGLGFILSETLGFLLSATVLFLLIGVGDRNRREWVGFLLIGGDAWVSSHRRCLAFFSSATVSFGIGDTWLSSHRRRLGRRTQATVWWREWIGFVWEYFFCLGIVFLTENSRRMALIGIEMGLVWECL